MSVVLDSNALIVLTLDRRRGRAVEDKLKTWGEAGEAMHAPALLRYEVASALTRAVVVGELDASQVPDAWARIAAVRVILHPLDDVSEVVDMATRLGRESAYDASYVVLAQRLGAELWTLDGPLARNASGHGLPVRLIETT